ncbi:uncharacterized protein N7498_008683 [Penicillium cinerascens]|uniref:Uncharacterized protein n=1 Tax=Penicillium cinerascens TaxID=70096 RepID=A0A9W9JE74_9EURO|nr:uncharacterized protein N7498_008683 [Penicillium cinerascens]KAJ5195245.1 hypothetical protein N7498_008683 [Penicillium cinerascens]
MSAPFGASDAGSQGDLAGENPRQQASPATSSSIGTTPENAQIALPEDIEAELQHYNFLLEQLLDVISRGEEDSVSRVISVIRSGGSHRQILDIIKQQSDSQTESNAVI